MAMISFSRLSDVLLGSVPTYVDTDHKLVKLKRHKSYEDKSFTTYAVLVEWKWEWTTCDRCWAYGLMCFWKALGYFRNEGSMRTCIKWNSFFKALPPHNAGSYCLGILLVAVWHICLLFCPSRSIFLHLERMALFSHFWGLLHAVSLLSTRPQREWLCTHIIPEQD